MSSISCEPQVMARMRAPRRDLIVPTSGYCWAAIPVSLVASLVREGSRRRLGVGAVWDGGSRGRFGPDDVPALRVGVVWSCVKAVLVTCGSSMAIPEWKPSELVLVDVTAMVLGGVRWIVGSSQEGGCCGKGWRSKEQIALRGSALET